MQSAECSAQEPWLWAVSTRMLPPFPAISTLESYAQLTLVLPLESQVRTVEEQWQWLKLRLVLSK